MILRGRVDLTSDKKAIQMPVIEPERPRSVDLAMLAIGWLAGICLTVIAVTALLAFIFVQKARCPWLRAR